MLSFSDLCHFFLDRNEDILEDTNKKDGQDTQDLYYCDLCICCKNPSKNWESIFDSINQDTGEEVEIVLFNDLTNFLS